MSIIEMSCELYRRKTCKPSIWRYCGVPVPWSLIDQSLVQENFVTKNDYPLYCNSASGTLVAKGLRQPAEAVFSAVARDHEPTPRVMLESRFELPVSVKILCPAKS